MTPRTPEEQQDTATERRALDPRKVMLVSGGLMGIFGGLMIWALQAPTTGPATEWSPRTSPDVPEPASPRASSTLPSETPGAGALTGAPSAVNDSSPEAWRIADSPTMEMLLDQQFLRRRPDGSARLASLRSVLESERNIITVINVWATYCEPCKREFPGFRQLQSNWGNDVRFLPIQIGDEDLGPLRELMPLAPDKLVDLVPGGVVQETLDELDLLPPAAPIPITLVLDCKQKLRWLHAREVKDMAGFDAMVTKLRAELRSKRCMPPPERPIIPAPAEVFTDSCKPACKPPQVCRLGKAGRHICVDEVE